MNLCSLLVTVSTWVYSKTNWCQTTQQCSGDSSNRK